MSPTTDSTTHSPPASGTASPQQTNTPRPRLRAPLSTSRFTYLWLVVGIGVGLFAVGGRWDLSLLAWVAPVFLLRFARTARLGIAILGVWVASVAATLFWFFQVAIPGTPMTVIGALITGSVMSVPYVLDRTAGAMLPPIGRIALMGASMASVEFLLGVVSPFGTAYGLTAVTQHSNLGLLQVIALAGPYVIGFLVGMLATSIVHWWERGLSRTGVLVPTVAALVVVTIALGGQARQAWMPAPTAPTVTIAGINPNTALLDELTALGGASFLNAATLAGVAPAELRAAFTPINDRLLDDTAAAAKGGAKIVTWSENAARVSVDDEADFIARAAAVARENDIYLNAAMLVLTDSGATSRDQTVMLSPAGEVLSTYRKHKPIPGLEPYDAGPGDVPVIDTPYGTIASIICYDADFPDYARIDADIVLVPGGDWDELGWIHTKMSSLRAIENGYSLVRTDFDGSSQAFDRHGTVLSMQDTTQPNVPIWYAEVPTESGDRTLYNATGDVFAWLSALSTLSLSAWAVIRRRR